MVWRLIIQVMQRIRDTHMCRRLGEAMSGGRDGFGCAPSWGSAFPGTLSPSSACEEEMKEAWEEARHAYVSPTWGGEMRDTHFCRRGKMGDTHMCRALGGKTRKS